MKAMKNNKEQYPTLEVYGELDKNGKMTDPNYIANDKVPQITQYRIRDDAELQRYITDKAEVARIQAEVQNG